MQAGKIPQDWDQSNLQRYNQERYNHGEPKALTRKSHPGKTIGGEGGEYETLVLDGPMFNKKIVIQKSEKIWKGDSGLFLVKKAKLASKGKK